MRVFSFLFKNSAFAFTLLAGFFLVLTFNRTLRAQFKYRETKHLRLIYYDQQHAYITTHLARCFENSLKFHCRIFNYKPREKATILLTDLDDYGHGGTSTMPWNFLNIGLEPFDYVFETQPANERMNWLMHHELTHMVTIDKPAPIDRFFRRLFAGKVIPIAEAPETMLYSYLTNPRWYCPRWYHEGIAVFMETWMSGGLGRALGGYDEMVFRTMVLDSAYFYDVVGLESEGTTIDFQIGAISYLYGTRFVSYLAYRYGPQKALAWFNRSKQSKRYFSSDFKRIFKKDLARVWRDWIRWEHRWQKANIDSLRRFPITSFRPLSRQALGSVSRCFIDSAGQKIYAAINYPGQLAQIAAIDLRDGRIEKLCEVHTSALYYVTFLAFDPQDEKFYYSSNNSHGWRSLKMFDLRTKKSTTLLKNTRCGDLVFNRHDHSLWGVQHHNGISRLMRFLPPYRDWQEILSLPYGKDIFDLDISPDGKYLTASFIEVDGRQRLIRLPVDSLLAGNSNFEVLYEFENTSPSNFVFSPNGRFLYGSSYYTGVSNIWRYDFKTRQMDIVSNCESGFFRPLPYKKDSLIVFKYTGKGFLPGVIPVKVQKDVSAVRFLGQAVVEKYPIVKTWKAPSPATVKIDTLFEASGDYKPLERIRPASIFPVIRGYKDYAAFGIRSQFSDPLGFDDFTLSLSYAPAPTLKNDEKLHAELTYNHWPWKVSAAYNRADFYDLFGPTKVSRKGYYLGLQYEHYFINEKPEIFKFTVQAFGFGGLEKLPNYQNISTSAKKLLIFKTVWDYSYLLRSLGAVEYEKGRQWRLTLSVNYSRKWFPSIHTELDYGFLLPLNHSSIWFRGFAGFAFGRRNEPFANFYFGGFGNNWIDHRQVNRYREFYSFPGVNLNAVGGANYAKLLSEWDLPPLRFRRFGIPSFYFTWLRLAFFSGGIVTDADYKANRRALLDTGLQINWRVVMLSHLNVTLSFGWARAYEKHQRPNDEIMISLKIL